jgi:hypothetical protein
MAVLSKKWVGEKSMTAILQLFSFACQAFAQKNRRRPVPPLLHVKKLIVADKRR